MIMKNIFYDEIKDFKRLNNCTEKVELAISRLENPYGLSDSDISIYKEYLKKQAPEVVSQFIDLSKVNIFPQLVKYKVIKKSNILKLTDYARESRKFDILSYLMEIGNNLRNNVDINTTVEFVQNKNDESYDILKYSKAKAGEIIWLGEKAMPWLVLENKNGRLLVISMYVIDCKPFENTYIDKPWSKSTISFYVNNDYLNSVLSEKEIQRIVTVYINDKDELYFEKTENSADNKLFFLSVNETKKYLKTEKSRMAPATQYAVSSSLWTIFDQYAYWWLRSQGRQKADKYYVRDGNILSDNSTVEIWNYQSFGIRPAMYIDFR